MAAPIEDSHFAFVGITAPGDHRSTQAPKFPVRILASSPYHKLFKNFDCVDIIDPAAETIAVPLALFEWVFVQVFRPSSAVGKLPIMYWAIDPARFEALCADLISAGLPATTTPNYLFLATSVACSSWEPSDPRRTLGEGDLVAQADGRVGHGGPPLSQVWQSTLTFSSFLDSPSAVIVNLLIGPGSRKKLKVSHDSQSDQPFWCAT